eukprot:5099052-Prymnesium_polylepis.1
MPRGHVPAPPILRRSPRGIAQASTESGGAIESHPPAHRAVRQTAETPLYPSLTSDFERDDFF